MSRRAPLQVAAEIAREPVEVELARFFGYSRDVLAIMDGRGRVLLISPSVERVLGHAVEEIIGQRLVRWVHPEDRGGVSTATRSLLAGQPRADVDARVARAAGGWVPMRWSLSLGPRQRLYAVGQDRTDATRRREALLLNEVNELRLRTAMELHDGILQTLTAAGLHIELARRLVGTDPAAAEDALRALAESVSAEQREIRLYVDEVRGGAPVLTDGGPDLSERIATIIKRVGMIWSVATSVRCEGAEGIAPELGRRILRIIQEATVNAARHGAARNISVEVAREGGDMAITVVNDGHGFPFHGDYDDEALKSNRLGPVSLKHRVQEAGGRIRINSTPGGSTLVVRVPLPGTGAP